jgi:hypothetical protein
MKNLLFVLLTVSLLMACSQLSQTEKELREVLNTSIQFGTLDTITHMGSLLTLKQLCDSYKYKSVVYLENGCMSCYTKFAEWHQKMDSLELGENYTILFVIRGNGYSDFMSKVLDLGYVNDRYYTIMDANYSFLDANENIPSWIIDASVLIDSENKIEMVGEPWLNEDMKNLFYEIVNNEQ